MKPVLYYLIFVELERNCGAIVHKKAFTALVFFFLWLWRNRWV